MEAKFSQRVKNVLTYSREEAIRLNNSYIGLEHLLLGMIREGEGMAIHKAAFIAGKPRNRTRDFTDVS